MASANEMIFTLEATPVKFGAGAVEDAGWELPWSNSIVRRRASGT